MECSECHRDTHLSELLSYSGRCEDCWVRSLQNQSGSRLYDAGTVLNPRGKYRRTPEGWVNVESLHRVDRPVLRQ